MSYQQFNMLEDPSPLGRFDVVFCRNVLIYFDRADRASVLLERDLQRRCMHDSVL